MVKRKMFTAVAAVLSVLLSQLSFAFAVVGVSAESVLPNESVEYTEEKCVVSDTFFSMEQHYDALEAAVRERVLQEQIAALYDADSENEETTATLRTITNDEELKQYAEELGVLTDTFPFSNQNAQTLGNILEDSESVLQRIQKDALQELSDIDIWGGKCLGFASLFLGGFCYGISGATVLSHNGYLMPSEMQEGAVNLHDVSLNDQTAYLLGRFAVAQCYTAVEIYLYSHLQNTTEEERVAELLRTAEKCTAEGKYFFVAFKVSPPLAGAHAVTGLGVANGSWTFHEKHYDKCILVSDSNAKNNDGSAMPFSTRACIYINSETNTFYIPVYDTSSENEGQITMTIDDPEVLLYHAPLNAVNAPSVFENLDNICITLYGDLPKEVQIYQSDGTSHTLNKNDLTDGCIQNGTGISHYTDGEIIKAVISPARNADLVMTSDCYLARGEMSAANSRNAPDSYVILSRDRVVLQNNSEESRGWIYMRLDYNESSYSEQLNNFIFISYELLQGNAAIELHSRTDGLELITDQDRIWGKIFLNAGESEKLLLDPNAQVRSLQTEDVQIAFSKVLFKYQDETGELEFYVDQDDNGTYETKIQKGDTNGDGVAFDAVDAQMALKAYVNSLAKASKSKDEVNNAISDMDGDGEVTAADAQLILRKYVDKLALK